LRPEIDQIHLSLHPAGGRKEIEMDGCDRREPPKHQYHPAAVWKRIWVALVLLNLTAGLIYEVIKIVLTLASQH
jgi:hypothetical protein